MTKEQMSAFKDVHECQEHNTALLLPRKNFNNAFKWLESEGLIYALKFNTYSIRLTALGMAKAIELMQKREL